MLLDIEPDQSNKKIIPWFLPSGRTVTFLKMSSVNLYVCSLDVSRTPVREVLARAYDDAAFLHSNSFTR